MSEKPQRPEQPEDIAARAELMHETLDHAWMYACARKRVLERQVAIDKEGIEHDEDSEYYRQHLAETEEQLRALNEQMRAIKKSGVFDTQEEGYSLAREAIAWLEKIHEAWAVAGPTPEAHVLQNAASDMQENPIEDEHVLRIMEDIGMEKVEEAMKQEVPRHLKERMIEALTAYATIGDNSKLIKRAAELAEELKEEQE